MEVINETGLQAAWLQGRIGFPQHSLTLIVKGTFRLTPGGTASLDEEMEQPPVTGDLFYDEEPENGLRYENDLVHYKPRADLLLAGTCHAPGGQAVTACRVSFGVGERIKTLGVVGDRAWTSEGPGARPSDPAAFTTMPLDYRRAFGGEGFAQNPLGKGAAKILRPDGRAFWPLPNLVDPDQANGKQGQALTPVGFGPLDRMLPQRRTGMGTYDDKWQEERWPWYPEDFGWGHFNTAPADQQVDGYLRGDEALYFENLHPEHAHYRSRLPGLRLRCFLHEVYEGRPLFREVPMNLDTLWVDMDAEQAVLLWRGLAKVRSEDSEELGHLVVASEPLAEPPLPAEHYVAFLPLAGEAEAAEASAAMPAADLAAEEAELDRLEADPALDAEVKEEVGAALDKMRDELGVSRLELDRAKAILFAADPTAALHDFVRGEGLDPAEFDGLIKKARQDALSRMQARGLEKDLLAEIAQQDAAPETASQAPDLSGRAVPGGDFSGEDLSGADFSGRDLKGAIFKDAILAGANFDQADLGESDFSAATLAGARFCEANLAAARFDEADLTGAHLKGANLQGASLAGVLAEEADLSGASLAGTSAPRANLSGANLTDANLEAAGLASADLSGARLDRANLKDADLGEASLEGAFGEALAMSGAKVGGLRAGGCRFPGGAFRSLSGEGSLWFEADLSNAEFTASDLIRADFRESNLRDSDFHTVDLRDGNLTKANLGGARFTQVNLFQVRLDKADLSGTDLRGSNCYAAEFIDAVISETRFEQANLKMTKLARLSRRG